MQRSAKCQHVNFRILGKRTMRPVHRGTRARWTTLPVTFPLRFSNSFMMIGQWSVVSGQLPLLYAFCLPPTASLNPPPSTRLPIVDSIVCQNPGRQRHHQHV